MPYDNGTYTTRLPNEIATDSTEISSVCHNCGGEVPFRGVCGDCGFERQYARPKRRRPDWVGHNGKPPIYGPWPMTFGQAEDLAMLGRAERQANGTMTPEDIALYHRTRRGAR